MREDDKNITGYDEPMGLNIADEQMIQMFFADHQEEIPDDGFSQRVMKKYQLPGLDVWSVGGRWLVW